MAERTVVAVDDRELALSNLEKVLYPASGTTKAQVIDYYARIADAILPHLRDRPLTLKRYPDGVDGEYFYEKNCPTHRPDWVRTVEVPTEGSGRWGRPQRSGATIDFCVVDDRPTLVWVANLASLELHPYLHRADDLDAPTLVAFDLDPGAPAGIVECARIALRLRELLGELGLEAFPKTSGSKGMQVYLPLNTPTTYERTTPFAKAVAQVLERQDPDGVTSNMSKQVRGGRVFVDWSQNSRHKTTVGVYSLRARARPTASTPVTWDEVEAAADAVDPDALTFELHDVLERVADHGDPFAPVATLEQQLPDLG